MISAKGILLFNELDEIKKVTFSLMAFEWKRKISKKEKFNAKK